MKKSFLRVFFELIKNSKKSDRDIAKSLNLSQPTVTRIRKKLETMGFISEYTVVPDFTKLGFEIVAFVFFNANRCRGPEAKKKGHDWIQKNPSIMFSAAGDGIRGKNCSIVTIHKNFTEYTNFINDFKRTFGEDIGTVETFLVSLRSPTPKNLSFRNLTKMITD